MNTKFENLQGLKMLLGRTLNSSDGEIGRITDLLFDRDSWSVRYLLASGGDWLKGRQVLLSPYAFGPNPFAKLMIRSRVMVTTLTKAQIAASPALYDGRPITPKDEEDYHRHFGWPYYGHGESLWEVVGFSSGESYMRVNAPQVSAPAAPVARPLMSIKTLLHFEVLTSEGIAGKVEDVLISPETWSVRQLELETGHWYRGKTVLVLPENVTGIDLSRSVLKVNLSRREIRDTPRNDVVHAGAYRA